MADESREEPVYPVILGTVNAGNAFIQLSTAREAMGVVHRNQAEVTRCSPFFRQEDIVVVRFPRGWVWGVAITIQRPCVENNQWAQFIWVVDLFEFPGRSAPRMPALGSRDKGRPRLRVAAMSKRDLIVRRHGQDCEVKRGQLEPARQLCAHPVTSQGMWALRVAQRLDVSGARVRYDAGCTDARFEPLLESLELRGLLTRTASARHIRPPCALRSLTRTVSTDLSLGLHRACQSHLTGWQRTTNS